MATKRTSRSCKGAILPGRVSAVDSGPVPGPSTWLLERSRQAAERGEVWRPLDDAALVRHVAALEETLQACFQSWKLCTAE